MTTTQHATVVPIHRPRPALSVQGALALDMTPRVDVPDVGDQAPAAESNVMPRRDRSGLEVFVRRYVLAAAEIAIGDRPVAQLLRHTDHEVYQDLARRAQVVSAAAGTSLSAGRGRGAVRPTLVSARTTLIDADTVEASAHLRYGQRSRALAARFEKRQGRWQCTALQWA